MKHSRIAALVVGSVAVIGSASPALAADMTAMPPMSLNGGLTKALSSTQDLGQADTSAVTDIARTVTDLNNVKGQAPQQVLKSAASLTPMLGGVELGG